MVIFNQVSKINFLSKDIHLFCVKTNHKEWILNSKKKIMNVITMFA